MLLDRPELAMVAQLDCAMTGSTMTLRVERVQDETPEIRRFVMARPDGAALPPFTPGSHVDLHLGAGLIRQYSLCNGPEERDTYTIAVKRESESRGGSQRLHDAITVGEMITVGVPRNHFPLATAARRHLLLAGGIGVTPLLSMARHLKATGSPFELKYFTRSPAHTAFHAELASPRWAKDVSFHYAIEPERLGSYLRSVLDTPSDGRHVYVCGPRPFMDLVLEVASHHHSANEVHSEYFSADSAALAAPRATFRIRCARSSLNLEVPADATIVDVLTRNNVDVAVSCEQGVCGTCLTGVLEGIPDHRDVFLTDEEKLANDKILICCSRSFSETLVLDL